MSKDVVERLKDVPQNTTIPKGFFAYPSSPPSIPPTISAAIESINRSYNAEILSWESLEINGRYIISEICSAIDEADFFCADVTGINPNVLFELGYAIASNKRIWLIRDESYTESKKEFEQLKLLTTVGFSSYVNSEHIVKAFFQHQPHLTLDKTIFNDSIKNTLSNQSGDGSILYVKSRYETEASIQVTRALENSRIDILEDDPRETSVRPLYWYAQQLWEALALVAHFVSPARVGFRLNNAKYALVCGLARGFEIPVLMLTEQSDMLAPIDYRDEMWHYTTPKEAASIVEEWLLPIRREDQKIGDIQASYAASLRLATELKDFHIQLGDYVAENDRNLNDYFVDTTVSSDILNGTQSVFVGRKGTGKTATLIHTESIIGADARNLVCLIKPVGYEIEGLVRLFSKYKLQDYKGYVIESLWKYMLYTELARAAASQINSSALWELNEPDARQLISLLEDESKAFNGEFAVRLEKVVSSLELLPVDESGEVFRRGISEALHSGALSKLRVALGRVLSKKRQVILLVDNLDKSWTKTADLGQLAEFLLGLLTAANRVGDELNRGERGGPTTRFSSAIFLRSDIFERVLEAAREPDKLSFTRLDWEDPELLLRVIEERYVASHGDQSDPSTMWHKYFCPKVRSIPTREYLTSRILQRPRDILYLVKAAVSFAVNRKHDRVEERDILDGEKQYSLYALDSILVENGISIPQLESVLFEFLGSNSKLSEVRVKQLVSTISIPIEKVDHVVEHLVKLSFLGLEVSKDKFAYSDEVRTLRKHQVLSQRFLETTGAERQYEINFPFRAYLEINEI